MHDLADLHRHLDGSLRPETLRELLPELKTVLRFEVGMGLEAALACFATTLSALQTPEAVERVASEICEDAAADGVSTLEVRFGPFLHGEDASRFVDAAVSGLAGRGGLILCGMYGDPVEKLQAMVGLARPGVVGVDLAGGPAPHHDVGLADYAPAFREAARRGLGRTVHAAEGRSCEEIRVAVEVLGAQRIGHGTTLLEDESVLELVLERGVVIEACPTSNVHVGAMGRVEEHPLAEWLRRGVRATINTDNTLLSAVSARSEHTAAMGISGMTEELLAMAVAHGHAGAFG